MPGLRRLGADEIPEVEPHARGVAALHSPNTGIVDFGKVAEAYAEDVRAAGGGIDTGRGVTGLRADGIGIEIEYPGGHDARRLRRPLRRRLVRSARGHGRRPGRSRASSPSAAAT